jgi:amino-acid N-acetyltransferase
MVDDTVSLRPAGDALPYVERLLAASGLPTRDVPAKPDCFYVGHANGERVGVGGLEVHGTDGLVRSIVVEAFVRGNGYGRRLCDALEDEARSHGVETVYLLTTTAADFFDGRGYERVDRSEAPASIRRTAEFDELCSGSATCLRKSL